MNSLVPKVPAADFRLSVTRALRDQLIESLATIEPAPLVRELIDQLEPRGGVYELFDDEVLVYIGKSNHDLPGRLNQHGTKLGGRVGGLLDRVTFKCVYVDEDLHAVSAETLLIDAYRAQQQAVWNTNGFGNKDPGQQRDTSEVKAAHFDALYPIDLDQPVAVTLPEAPVSVNDMLWAVKAALPYNFRFDQTAATKRDLEALAASIDTGDFETVRTARGWFEWLAGALPESWTLVALPGYVIGYPNRPATRIPSRIGSWSRDGDTVTFQPHEAALAAGAVKVDDLSADV
ncbi:MAG: GIY-YIG nuclease family protein [Cellulomonas sp.]|nr:GIY-YIG nuclease family protein [Cellulomonas sp.]MCR6647296.1 GIY-YIG nuclease family protein [Cellulomonas sp.]